MEEELQYNEENTKFYIQKIQELYEQNPETVNSANNDLLRIKQYSPNFEFQASLMIINNEYPLTIKQYCCTAIQQFLSPTEYHKEEQIVAAWYNPEIVNREGTYQILIFIIHSQNQTIQNLGAQIMALICNIDETFYLYALNEMMTAITEQKGIEPVLVALKFFNELLETDFLESHFKTPPEFIISLVGIVPNMFFQNYDISIRTNAVRLSILLFQKNCFQESCIPDFIAGIKMAQETINPYTSNELYMSSFKLLNYIIAKYYEKYWELIFPLVTDPLKCEASAEEHANGSLHERMIGCLYFWKFLAKFEYKQMNNGNYQGLVKRSIPVVVPLILHVLYPSDPESIELDTDDTTNRASVFASCALDQICIIEKEEVFPILEEFFNKEDGEVADILAKFLAVSSLTHGHAINDDEKEAALEDFLGKVAFTILPDFALNENQRIREAALFLMFRIIKKISPACRENFDMIIELIKPNANGPYLIRARCSDLLKNLCKWTPKEYLDLMFDSIRELSYAIAHPAECDPSEYMIKPLSSICEVINQCSNDKFPYFQELIFEDMGVLQTSDNIFDIKCATIEIGALSKRMGQDIGEYTSEIFASLLNNIEKDDIQLLQETNIALLNVLDTGKVSPDFIEAVRRCAAIAEDKKDELLVSGAIRILGKYIANINDDINKYIDDTLIYFYTLMDRIPNNVPVFAGVMLALSELTKAFVELSYPLNEAGETIDHVIQLLRRGMTVPLNYERSQVVANAILVSYANIYRMAERPEIYEASINSVRRFVLYIESLQKEKNVDNEVLRSACTGLVFAGRAFKKRVNQFLNRTKVLAFIKRGKDISELSDFTKKTYDEITSL